MNALTAGGIPAVFHYAPLHYLLFIVRSGALLSKRELIKSGFAETHFRSTSRRQDVSRGFDECVHLTVEEMPPIVAAKLKSGFPHFTLRIPSASLNHVEFDLCRFNIARCRFLRRGDSAGPEASANNGFYQKGQQLPVARGGKQQEALIAANYGRNMIEILIRGSFRLPSGTEFVFHHVSDLALAAQFLETAETGIAMNVREPIYYRNEVYARRVKKFLERASEEPDWRGDGLDFDRV